MTQLGQDFQKSQQVVLMIMLEIPILLKLVILLKITQKILTGNNADMK